MTAGQSGDQRAHGQQASQAGGDPADWSTIKEDVTDIAGAAVERGRTFLDSARSQATDYVGLRKESAAQSVADVASALREATRPFEDRPQIRAFVDSAAEGLDQLADSIRERSVAEIYEDIEEVMRRRPAVVAAASLVAGFFLARFIKSSAEDLRREEERRYRRTGAVARHNRPSRHTGSYNAA